MPDPRSRRGRWYSLTAILLVCACAVVSGARSIEELAEWGANASSGLLTAIGIRCHPLRWRRAPSPATIGRVLGAVNGDALDRAVGAYLADRHRGVAEQYASGGFLVMADPEGNEFCVIPPGPFDLDDDGRTDYLVNQGSS
ncbi:hypothetical protein FEF34_02925 [Streptomyces marianii]|uniref:H repeat-associated protein N-terminal domain-containing protein n=1 Tax=Streptomyces marianii TaxID=1817406 RepID=A0A5R9EJK8_9ACTN|nr:hypothetical protein FEF34_02925 [Streptomyces marianii]